LSDTDSEESTLPDDDDGNDAGGFLERRDRMRRKRNPTTLRALATETRLLYRDVMRFSSSPRVVDLTALNKNRTGGGSGRGWVPKKKTPAAQVLERKMQAEKLGRRVQGLLERASVLGERL
jgi:dynactin 1